MVLQTALHAADLDYRVSVIKDFTFGQATDLNDDAKIALSGVLYHIILARCTKVYKADGLRTDMIRQAIEMADRPPYGAKSHEEIRQDILSEVRLCELRELRDSAAPRTDMIRQTTEMEDRVQDQSLRVLRKTSEEIRQEIQHKARLAQLGQLQPRSALRTDMIRQTTEMEGRVQDQSWREPFSKTLEDIRRETQHKAKLLQLGQLQDSGPSRTQTTRQATLATEMEDRARGQSLRGPFSKTLDDIRQEVQRKESDFLSSTKTRPLDTDELPAFGRSGW
jgi:hypothetical protein